MPSPPADATSVELETSVHIEAYLKAEKKRFEKVKNEPRLLLLGSSDSGKSTVLKQLKIIHGAGFSQSEFELSRKRITSGIFNIVNYLLGQMKSFEQSHIPIRYNPFLSDCEAWQSGNEQKISRTQILSMFNQFMNEPEIQYVVKAGGLNLPDTWTYFVANVERIFSDGYIPSNQDVLNLRTVTQNVSDTIFEIKSGQAKKTLHIIDVSGLSHHRGRWISYFDDCSVVVFVASLSCYDQNMAEETDVNRMVDSLVLFENMVNHKLLEKKDFVLFLNKKDLYEEKVKTRNIIDYFPNYKGKAGSSSQGIKYFDGKFRDRNTIEKVIRTHVTQATSTEMMQVIIKSLISSLISSNIESAGIGES